MDAQAPNTKVRFIPVEVLTPEAYAPFGYVVGMPHHEPLARDEERSFWGSPELELLDGAFMVVYVEMRRTDYVVRQLHRHRAFSQTLVPLGGQAFIHVAAPPTDVPDLDQMRAFLVEGNQAVIIGRGTWHRNPAYPVASKASLILISRSQTTTGAAAQPGAATVGGDTDRLELNTLTDNEIRLIL